MNKEQTLDILKHLVLQLRDNSKEIQANPNLTKDWVAKSKMVQDQLKSMNSCDALWFNEEYGKWHKKEIEPYASKLDSSLYKQVS